MNTNRFPIAFDNTTWSDGTMRYFRCRWDHPEGAHDLHEALGRGLWT